MVLFERGSAAWQNILATFTRSAVVMLAFCGASLATCNRKGGQASGMPRRFVGGEGTCSSSTRHKEQVKPATFGLLEVMELHPVDFELLLPELEPERPCQYRFCGSICTVYA
jgi:hypothetical protein